jgi:hypothetical protein
VMEAPESASADDCFARRDVAELTIELATIGWPDWAGSPAGSARRP